MPQQLQIRLDLIINWRFWMLVIVKYADLSVLGLCAEDLWLLGHIPGLIDFALVVDLHVNGNARLLSIGEQFVVLFIFFIVAAKAARIVARGGFTASLAHFGPEHVRAAYSVRVVVLAV